jgi:hypothetical protein
LQDLKTNGRITHTQIGRHGMDSSNSGQSPEIMQSR